MTMRLFANLLDCNGNAAVSFNTINRNSIPVDDGTTDIFNTSYIQKTGENQLSAGKITLYIYFR